MFLSDIQNNFIFLQDWVLTPSPYFFPDLLLYFLIDRGDIGTSIFIYVYIFSLSLFYLVSNMILNAEKQFQLSDVLLIFMVTNVFLLSNNKLCFFYSPVYHSSIYLFGIFLIIHKNSLNRKVIILIYFLSFLFGLSDPFVLLQIIIPLIFYSLISNFNDKHLLKSNLTFYIKVFLFSILGKLFISGLHKNKMIIVPEVPIFKTFLYILKNFLFIDNLTKSFHYFLYDFFEVKILYIIILIFIFLFIFDKKQTKIEIFWTFLFTTLLLFIFQGWFGLWIGYRYMWFFYIFPLSYIVYYILLKFNFFSISKDKIQSSNIFKKEHIIISLSIIILIFQFFLFQKSIETIFNFYIKDTETIELNLSSNNLVNYKTQKIVPEVIICITNLSKKYNLKKGISDYWNAKYITFFSNNQLLINQYTSELEEYYWINNKNNYKNNDEYLIYNFIITNRLNESKILEFIGIPDFKEKCGENNIWIYKNNFQLIQ